MLPEFLQLKLHESGHETGIKSSFCPAKSQQQRSCARVTYIESQFTKREDGRANKKCSFGIVVVSFCGAHFTSNLCTQFNNIFCPFHFMPNAGADFCSMRLLVTAARLLLCLFSRFVQLSNLNHLHLSLCMFMPYMNRISIELKQ